MAPSEDKDVLPPFANKTLILLWLLLPGGRWLAFPFLMGNPNLAEWDRRILFPCYLVLLTVTLIVLALRQVRRGRTPALPGVLSEQDQTTHAEPSDPTGAPKKPPNSARSSEPSD